MSLGPLITVLLGVVGRGKRGSLCAVDCGRGKSGSFCGVSCVCVWGGGALMSKAISIHHMQYNMQGIAFGSTDNCPIPF